MSEERTKARARKDKAQGKSPSTQAGEFVREEVHHVREGKHGARSSKQLIAIGLSKARRAGVALPPPKRGTTSERTRKSADRDAARGKTNPARTPAPRRSRAAKKAIKREGTTAGTATALSRQALRAAAARGPAARSQSARRAAATQGATRRKTPARKAAHTRRRKATSRA